MGHISSANANRLGWTKGWSDSFYSPRSYYNIYFFMFLKIRLFLQSLFLPFYNQKSGSIFSHVFMYKRGFWYGLQIYLYSIDFQRWTRNFSYSFSQFVIYKVRSFFFKNVLFRKKTNYTNSIGKYLIRKKFLKISKNLPANQKTLKEDRDFYKEFIINSRIYKNNFIYSILLNKFKDLKKQNLNKFSFFKSLKLSLIDNFFFRKPLNKNTFIGENKSSVRYKDLNSLRIFLKNKKNLNKHDSKNKENVFIANYKYKYIRGRKHRKHRKFSKIKLSSRYVLKRNKDKYSGYSLYKNNLQALKKKSYNAIIYKTKNQAVKKLSKNYISKSKLNKPEIIKQETIQPLPVVVPIIVKATTNPVAAVADNKIKKYYYQTRAGKTRSMAWSKYEDFINNIKYKYDPRSQSSNPSTQPRNQAYNPEKYPKNNALGKSFDKSAAAFYNGSKEHSNNQKVPLKKILKDPVKKNNRYLKKYFKTNKTFFSKYKIFNSYSSRFKHLSFKSCNISNLAADTLKWKEEPIDLIKFVLKGLNSLNHNLFNTRAYKLKIKKDLHDMLRFKYKSLKTFFYNIRVLLFRLKDVVWRSYVNNKSNANIEKNNITNISLLAYPLNNYKKYVSPKNKYYNYLFSLSESNSVPLLLQRTKLFIKNLRKNINQLSLKLDKFNLKWRLIRKINKFSLNSKKNDLNLDIFLKNNVQKINNNLFSSFGLRKVKKNLDKIKVKLDYIKKIKNKRNFSFISRFVSRASKKKHYKRYWRKIKKIRRVSKFKWTLTKKLLLRKKIKHCNDILISRYKLLSKDKLYYIIKNYNFFNKKRNFIKNFSKKFRKNSIFHFNTFVYLYLFSFLTGFRFNQEFDWKFWWVLFLDIKQNNYLDVYNYFVFRSLFGLKTYRYNLNSAFILVSLLTKANLSLTQGKEFFQELILNFYITWFSKPYFEMKWYFLKSWLFLFIGQNNFIGQINLINNDTVNACFLSKFLAKNLQYQHTIKGILRPIKKELKLLALHTVDSSSVSRDSLVNTINNLKWVKSFWRLIFTFLLSCFDSTLLSCFETNSSWYSLDYALSLTRNYSVGRHIFFHQKRLALYCLFLYNYKYEFNLKIANFKHFQIFFKDNFVLKIEDFYNIFFQDNLINQVTLFSYNLCITPTYAKIKKGLVHFSKFQKFTTKFLVLVSNSNRKFLNVFKDKYGESTFSEHLGYKISFAGRFSRKQRAGSFWISSGRVPLTRITAKIDYSNYTVPLKNSSASIKVWIGNNKSLKSQFFKKIY